MQETDPFVDTLIEWIDVSMRRSMRNFIHYSRQSGFSMSQFGAMFHLHRLGKCGVTDLGDHLGVTSAAASQMLERLVQQGLILRTEDPNDRRVKQIVLTDEGHRVLEESMHAQKGWLNDLSKSLSDSEKETVIAALKILIGKVRHLHRSNEAECKSS